MEYDMANRPSHYAYNVKDVPSDSETDQAKGIWTKIGAAWPHKDGKGFTAELDCIPRSGRIVVREASEAEA